jgi:hypothetical protein
MAFPAWLFALLVLVGVCFVAGWSSFKTMMEGFADLIVKAPAPAPAPSGKAGAAAAEVELPATIPAVKTDDATKKKYMDALKAFTQEVSTPIPPTVEQLTAITGGLQQTAVNENYTPHSEGFKPHEMPRQTEGFSIQQQVREPGQ